MSKRMLALILCLALGASLIPAAAAEDITIIDAGFDAAESVSAVDPAEKLPDEPVLTDGPARTVSGRNGEPGDDVVSGSCGEGLTWTLENGRLEISGSGAMDDYEALADVPWYEYRAQITELVLDPFSEITSIGKNAFRGCSNLAGPHLTASLTSIGEFAFLSCKKITDVYLAPGVISVGKQAFGYCSALRHLSFGGAPELEAWAFSDCSALKELSFLGGVPAFGYCCFENTKADAWYPSGGDSVWTEDDLQSYGGTLSWKPGYHGWAGEEIAWDYEPDSGRLTLSGTGETGRYVGDSYAVPSWYPFRDGITAISVGEGVTALEQSVFRGLAAAASASLPATLTAIGAEALAGTALRSLRIPAAVTAIGARAFEGCASLSVLRFLGHAPTAVDPVAFSGLEADAYCYPLPDWTEEVRQDYGGAITWLCDDRIGDAAVWALDASGELRLSGSGATWDYPIDFPAFHNFRGEITSAVIGEDIGKLGSFLFWGMSELESVVFQGRTEIGKECFKGGCDKLSELRFLGHAAPFGTSCFYEVRAKAFYYPLHDWTEEVRKDYGGYITWVCDDKVGDELRWSLDEAGLLSLSGSGASWDFIDEAPGFAGFRGEVLSLSLDEGVTALGARLFSGLDQITELRLPAALEAIGARALEDCAALTELRFLGPAPDFGEDCFSGVTATARYPANDPSWTEDVMQDYGGDITWQPFSGFRLSVTDRTKAAASTDLDLQELYSGSVSFTVTADKAVLVVVRDGEAYSVLPCAPDGDAHRFTLEVSADTELVLAFKGDANLDGKIESRDGNMVSRASVGRYNISDPIALLAADVDGNGKIESRDGNMISRASVNKFKISW